MLIQLKGREQPNDLRPLISTCCRTWVCKHRGGLLQERLTDIGKDIPNSTPLPPHVNRRHMRFNHGEAVSNSAFPLSVLWTFGSTSLSKGPLLSSGLCPPTPGLQCLQTLTIRSAQLSGWSTGRFHQRQVSIEEVSWYLTECLSQGVSHAS